MPLTPILRPGATDNSQLLLYSPRDFIGVEPFGEEGARGINRAAQWTRDVETAAAAEHRLDGVHNTPRIIRGIARAWFDPDTSSPTPASYSFWGQSYLMGEYERQHAGLFAVTQINGDGDVVITLGLPMPSADFGVLDLSEPYRFSKLTHSVWALPWIYGEAISTTKLRIRRRCTESSAKHGLHGHFAFALVG